MRRLAAAAEHDSEHPVARALVVAGAVRTASAFTAVAGGGVIADVDGARVRVGRIGWLAGEGVDVAGAGRRSGRRRRAARPRSSSRGAATAIGVLEVADTLRAGAARRSRRSSRSGWRRCC